MKLATILAAAVLFCASPALADGPCTPAVAATWGTGATTATTNAAASPALDSPVARARDLLARARLLDEAASNDDKAAIELTARLPTLRASAKAARERADRATGDDRETLVAHAEELEADVIVSEAEVISRKRTAVDNRQTAAALRARAVHIVREPPPDATSQNGASCDPPFRFTADGRKIYRIECFR
ncbi:MAG: hypothetical protein KIT84_26105 [Labilithrix sp.]|nr:hypothetical protein [Labilithrix sp.]MCW5814529.1 hypothetical protein [Labilithrix sp.]